jgi:hypothetical protein
MNEKREDRVSCRHVQRELRTCFDDGCLDYLPESSALHLTDCPSCRAELGKLRELSAGLGDLPVPDCGDNYRTNLLPSVRYRLDQSSSAGPKKDRIWAPSMALAILLAVALIRQPAIITPPSWVQPKVASTITETSNLANSDYESLSQALESRDSLALNLTGTELDLILSLSDTTTTELDDPVDQLVNMNDQAVEAVLKSMETTSIRS